MGFDRNQLVESLRNRIQNEVCALHSLLLYLPDCLLLPSMYFRVLQHTICCWTTGSVFLVAILELSFKRLWWVCFPFDCLRFHQFSFFNEVIQLIQQLISHFLTCLQIVYPCEIGSSLNIAFYSPCQSYDGMTYIA